MMLNSPAAVGCILSNAVKAAGGPEAAIQQCAAIYQGVYRSEPLPASEAGMDLAELSDQLVEEVLMAEYVKSAGPCPDEDPYHMRWMEGFDFFKETKSCCVPVPAITPDTPVVYLCNYKGEEEGIALYDKAKHLRVFVKNIITTELHEKATTVGK